MQGIGSTNISELPVTNNIGIVNQPIQPQMQPQQQQMQSQQMQSQQMRSNVELNIEPKPQGVTMDTSTTQSAYNELVGQIQQADKLGVTQLPSRDIPNNTDRVAMDQEIQPDYIPEQAAMEDYINNYQTPNDVILAGEREEQSRDRLDILYSNIQMPSISCNPLFPI